MSHPGQILSAVAALVAGGAREFSRDDVRKQLGLTRTQWDRGYTAIFQGMRDDHPGGAPPVSRRFEKVFHRVQRGRFVLSDFGKRRAHELRRPDVQGAGSARSSVERVGRNAGLRQVMIHPGEDGYWVAECPSLPGCISQGRTKAQAIAGIREAICAFVAALEDDNLPVPAERFEALLIAV
jgi:predicted RNase H-like HicB family nuclease